MWSQLQSQSTSKLNLRATQHSAAVQVGAVHVVDAGFKISTLDAAAHPAKPVHTPAEKNRKVNAKQLYWVSENKSKSKAAVLLDQTLSLVLNKEADHSGLEWTIFGKVSFNGQETVGKNWIMFWFGKKNVKHPSFPEWVSKSQTQSVSNFGLKKKAHRCVVVAQTFGVRLQEGRSMVWICPIKTGRPGAIS